MKIAMIFDGLGYGGIERVGISYIELLQELGHDVTVYNLNPKCNEMTEYYSDKCKVIEKRISNIIIPERYMWGVKKWRWAKYAYPLIYLGTSFLLYTKKLSMIKEPKYDIAIAFSGHFRDLSFLAHKFVRADKKICWLHGALMEYLLSASTYGDLYREIKNLCVLSDYGQDMALHTNQFLKSLNIYKIYNPIPDADMQIDNDFQQTLKEKYGDYLLMIGRFEEDKDQINVIQARKILGEKYNMFPKLIFVGGGKTLNKCKEYVAKIGLENDVIFYGARKDVGNFYSTAKLFLHSSPAEGLPTVLLEAMRYDLPIVATDSPPGVSEILGDNEFGLKCRVKDPEDMANKIYELLTNNDLFKTYQERGRNRLEDFSYSSIKKELSSILESIK